MVSTAPGLPRPADTIAEPVLLTPPPVRRCQPPATFDGASAEGSLDSLNTPPTVPRHKSFATYDDALDEKDASRNQKRKGLAEKLLAHTHRVRYMEELARKYKQQKLKNEIVAAKKRSPSPVNAPRVYSPTPPLPDIDKSQRETEDEKGRRTHEHQEEAPHEDDNHRRQIALQPLMQDVNELKRQVAELKSHATFVQKHPTLLHDLEQRLHDIEIQAEAVAADDEEHENTSDDGQEPANRYLIPNEHIRDRLKNEIVAQHSVAAKNRSPSPQHPTARVHSSTPPLPSPDRAHSLTPPLSESPSEERSDEERRRLRAERPTRYRPAGPPWDYETDEDEKHHTAKWLQAAFGDKPDDIDSSDHDNQEEEGQASDDQEEEVSDEDEDVISDEDVEFDEDAYPIDKMKLVIHYQSAEKGSAHVPVVLPYMLPIEEALERINSVLPASAQHYQPINDFSYMHGGDRKLVHDNSTYHALEQFSRKQNHEVHVELTQKGPAEGAHKQEESRKKMTLLIRYTSQHGVSQEFPVVLDYSSEFSHLGWYEKALKEITAHLSAAAAHYGPINDFSYMHGGDRKLVHDDSTYLALEAFSRQQNHEVHVDLTQKDALQMARHWNTQKHANVFEILKKNISKDTMLVHEFPDADVHIFYYLKGKKIRERSQLNSLEDDKGWLDVETIDWFLIWYCLQNKEPRNSQRVPDREEPGKPRKDARRGRCHPLEAGFWTLWMTPLPRNCSHKSQVTSFTSSPDRNSSSPCKLWPPGSLRIWKLSSMNCAPSRPSRIRRPPRSRSPTRRLPAGIRRVKQGQTRRCRSWNVWTSYWAR